MLDKADGIYCWDIEGKRYYDFLSACNAVSEDIATPHRGGQPEQAESSRSLPRLLQQRARPYEKYVTEYFGYDKVLPMNTGAEAVETAIKIARKWAYDVKGVPAGVTRS